MYREMYRGELFTEEVKIRIDVSFGIGGGIMAQQYVYEEVRRKTIERVENNFS